MTKASVWFDDHSEKTITRIIHEGREFVTFYDIDAVSRVRLEEWLDSLEAWYTRWRKDHDD